MTRERLSPVRTANGRFVQVCGDRVIKIQSSLYSRLSVSVNAAASVLTWGPRAVCSMFRRCYRLTMRRERSCSGS